MTSGYSERHVPLLGYAALAGTFAAGIAATGLAGRFAGRRLPRQLQLRDVAMAGVATYKLSRLISKDKVTTFLRAPFTEYEGSAGRGEVEESPRGTGFQRAVGELVTCPYCVGFWVATGFTAGLVLAPRPTRAVAGALDVLALSDALQMLDRAARESTGS